MSLKAFHIVFVTASVLLTFGIAAWSLVTYADTKRAMDLVVGLSCAAAGVVLLVYGYCFLKKLKNISYL
jgi:hypothetical protein